MDHAPGGYVERQIAEAIERGEFDHLPGAGAPLQDLTGFDSPTWWARKWIEREQHRNAAHSLAARVGRLRGELWRIQDEAAVRTAVDRINRILTRANRELPEREHLDLEDPTEVVAEWRMMARIRSDR